MRAGAIYQMVGPAHEKRHISAAHHVRYTEHASIDDVDLARSGYFGHAASRLRQDRSMEQEQRVRARGLEQAVLTERTVQDVVVAPHDNVDQGRGSGHVRW